MNNYYLPAEWQKQCAVQLTWPHQGTDWQQNDLLPEITNYFVKVAETILNYQNLVIVADNSNLKEFIQSLLNNQYKFSYQIFVSPSNDTWARDHGPITMINHFGDKKIMDFNFNAWGNKFNSEKDNLISSNLHNLQAYQANDYEKIDYILEGGAIDSNGKGLVLTTASCVLNSNRNHDLSNDEQVELLKKYLNIEQLVVIENSFLFGDDTDGHIDNLARFVDESTIVYCACDNPNNPNFPYLEKLHDELTMLKNGILAGIELIPIYIPDPIFNEDDEQLAASYINFLIINNAVLVPVYNDAKYDALAITTLKKVMINREVLGIESNVAVHQGGSLHCLTMQIPA